MTEGALIVSSSVRGSRRGPGGVAAAFPRRDLSRSGKVEAGDCDASCGSQRLMHFIMAQLPQTKSSKTLFVRK
jgi:hypothetical protein